MAVTVGGKGSDNGNDNGKDTPSDLIDADTVVLTSAATDRDAVIRALAGQAEKQDVSMSAPSSTQLWHARNSPPPRWATVGHPHARTAAVSVLTLAFGRLTPVEWDARTMNRSTSYSLIAVPEDAGEQHFKILAKLARALMKDDFRESLRSASSAEDVVDLVKDLGVEDVGAVPA